MRQSTGHKKSHKVRNSILIVLGVLLLLIVLALLWYALKISKIQYDTGNGEWSIDTEISIPDEGETIFQDSDIPVVDDGQPIEVPDGDVWKDENVFNILLLGTDERSKEFSTNARADSILVLSLNKKEKTIKLVSLGRATGVPIPGRNDDLLTHTFRYGGAELTMKTVQDCFKVDVEKYIRVNFHTFEQLIDSVGGVDIALVKKEADALNQLTSAGLTEGEKDLTGAGAPQDCRLRSIDTDWQRVERQRKTLQAAAHKAKTLNLLELSGALDDILPLVKTNLTKGEITSLLLSAPGYLGKDFEQMTIPVKGSYWYKIGVDGREMNGIDFPQNIRILREFLYGAE